MQFIKYIGVYDIERDEKLQRDCSLAAVKKMDYIIDTINNIGKPVQIISIARNKLITQKKTTEKMNNNELILAPSIGSKNRLKSKLGELEVRIWLFIWLILNIKKDEKIIVYHSQRIMNIIYWASKLKKFSYILEVEELYYKFGFVKMKDEKQEKRCISNAQSLIVSTDNIIKELSYEKEYIQLHGNYRNVLIDNKERKKYTSVVFAGGIETVRNTAFNVCDCARYLDHNFRVYLLGYGDEKAIVKLKEKIEGINNSLGEKRIIYCGTKIGQEYDEFMAGCDIAINFQNMDEYYMKYAFPSKVLNYLNYGLLVVTTPLETIRQSEISRLVFYPENMKNTAAGFAATIRKVENHLNEHKQLISDELARLNEGFKEDLKRLL